MGFANHGWHHEPHSPVKNSMCKRWDTLVAHDNTVIAKVNEVSEVLLKWRNE